MDLYTLEYFMQQILTDFGVFLSCLLYRFDNIVIEHNNFVVVVELNRFLLPLFIIFYRDNTEIDNLFPAYVICYFTLRNHFENSVVDKGWLFGRAEAWCRISQQGSFLDFNHTCQRPFASCSEERCCIPR